MKYRKVLLISLLIIILNCINITKAYAENWCVNSEDNFSKYKQFKYELSDENDIKITITAGCLDSDGQYTISAYYTNSTTDIENIETYVDFKIMNDTDFNNYKYVYDNNILKIYDKNDSSAPNTSFENDHTNDTTITSNSNFCYYVSGELFLKIKLNKGNYPKSSVLVDRWGTHFYNSNKETVLNWNTSNKSFDLYDNYIPANKFEVKAYTENSCPEKIAVTRDSARFTRQLHVYALYDNDAVTYNNIQSWCSNLRESNLYCYEYSAKLQSGMTEEQYQEALRGKIDTRIVSGDNAELSCEDIFGSITNSGTIVYARDDNNNIKTDKYGNKIILDEKPASLGYIIYKILSIARIIAIILVIVLGILDFAKSVMAGKEDEMRKNQIRFIKRLIACVVIFLVPTIISIIMNYVDERIALSDECLNATYKIIK